MRRFGLVLLLVFSGCLGNQDQGDGQQVPMVPIMPNLGTHMLNYTLPPAPSTAVLLLNVSEDLWIPWTTVSPFGVPVEDENWWTLCLLVELQGSSSEGRAAVLVLEVVDGHLVDVAPKSAVGQPTEVPAGAGSCVQSVWGPYPEFSLTSPRPRALQLAVFVTVSDPRPVASPPFLRVGIGTRPCTPFLEPAFGLPIGAAYCGPAQDAPAIPQQLTASGGRAAYSTYPEFCTPCGGFRVYDNRTATGPWEAGTLTVMPVDEQTGRIVAAKATSGLGGFCGSDVPTPCAAFGTHEVSIRAALIDGEVEVTCASTVVAWMGVQVGVRGWAPTQADFQATWTVDGDSEFTVNLYEFAADLDALGWSLATWVDSESFLLDGYGPDENPCGVA